jgi:hypothetical protein
MLTSTNQPTYPTHPPVSLATVRQVANVALGLSSLAKQLSGSHRASAYHLKASAISVLVLLGAVRVNGRREKNTFCLDLLADDRPVQIHCVLQDLLPEAQREILRQAENTRVVAPLGDRIGSDQLRRLKAHLPWGARRAA